VDRSGSREARVAYSAPGSSPPPPHRPWCFPPAGERHRPFSGGIPSGRPSDGRTPAYAAYLRPWLAIRLRPLSRCGPPLRAHVAGLCVPPRSGPPAPRGPSLRRLFAAPPSSLLLTSAARLGAPLDFPLRGYTSGLAIRACIGCHRALPPLPAVPFQRAMFSDPGESDGCPCPALPRR